MNLKKSIIVLSGLLLAQLLLQGCHNDSIPESEIVAKVGDSYLSREELQNWLPPNIPEDQKDAVVRQYIDRWIQTTSLYLSAKKQDISLEQYEHWAIRNLEKEMYAQKYLDQKLPKEIIVTDKEIEDYYNENKDEFIRSEEEVHLVHLFLEKKDQAIDKEIRESKSLLDVIERNYLSSQANRLLENNGDVGYVPVSQIRPEILRLVKYGSTGRIYGPIKVDSGVYYFQMLDKQPAGSYRSLDIVKEGIRLRLLNIKRDLLKLDIALKAKNSFSVESYPERLK